MRRNALRRGIVISLALCAMSALAGGQERPATAAGDRNAALRALAGELDARSRASREAAVALASAGGWETRLVSPDGRVMELQGLQDGLPLFYIMDNADAARSTRTDSVQLLIGGGAGFTIGLWDGDGPRLTHREIAPRATWNDPASFSDGTHATHVAGILIGAGVDPRARGMAPEASLNSWEWTDDLGEMASAAAGGLRISNHSYGHVRGWLTSYDPPYWFGDVAISKTRDYLFGFYSEETRGWDEVLSAAPYYLAVVSAGNDRNDAVEPGTRHRYWDDVAGTWAYSTDTREPDGGALGFDCLPDGNGTAKNTLVVAAAEDVPDYGGPDSVGMSYFSSWGPTDDGRIKPDIAGNGVALFSASNASDSSYVVYSGTSMASPNVCGSLALLQDYYTDVHGTPMRAATLKALALHTAREAGPAPGPDYMFGWGLLDALAAWRLIAADEEGTKGLIQELSLDEGEQIELYYESDGTAPLRATISWTDPPGEVPEPALDPREPRLVNDLDLRIARDGGGGEEHLPWRLDPDDPAAPAARGDNAADNVEQVVVDFPEAGVYILRVTHKKSLEGGAQDFSLVVSGGVRARTWHVFPDGSGDAPDVASAVAAAAPGDQIFLFPGIHEAHDVVVDKPLVIRGAGGRVATVVDAGGRGRGFLLGAGTGPVLLADLTVRGGVAPAAGRGRGGGVLVTGPGVTIDNCLVADCRAAAGGGIAAVGAAPAIRGCRIEGNSAGEGGGIYLLGADAAVSKCVIAWNEATISGGGVYAEGAAPRIARSTIARNRARAGGGVAAGPNAEIAVESSIVAFNGGGGLHAGRMGEVSVSCSDVWGNEDGDWTGESRDGTGTDGVIAADPAFCGEETMDIADSSPCRPAGNPCGVLMGAGEVSCHTRSYWYVRADGAGDMPTIQAAIDGAAPGDTILLAPGTYTGTGNREINFMGKQLVLRSEAGPELTVIDCFDPTGEAFHGFFFNHGEDTLSVLSGVTVTGAAGGGVVIQDASPLVTGCIVSGNRYDGGYRGGGIYVNSSSAVIRDCRITGNAASPNGGGIYCTGAEPLVERCIVSGNTATDYGGGVGVRSSSAITFRSCRIEENTATGNSGGGIHGLYSDMVVEDCLFLGNHAGAIGGGLYNGMGNTCVVTNTIIAFNTASSAGAGVYSARDLFMEACTVAGNSSPWYGSGLELYNGADNEIVRTIVAFNGPAQGIYSISGEAVVSCSDVYGNEGGGYGGGTPDQTGLNDNIAADPLFCDLDAESFGLLALSPCLPVESPCGELIGARGAGCGLLPDLVVSTVRAETTEAAGEDTVAVDVVVRNEGDAAADTFLVELSAYDVIQEETLADPPVNELLAMVPGLAPGESATMRFLLARAAPASWYGTAVADPNDDVAESDEMHNEGAPVRIVWGAPAGGELFTQMRPPWPNPTSGETGILFEIRERCPVEIVVYDVAGRRVRVLQRGVVEAGRHHAAWDGRNEAGRAAAPGIYFVRFRAGAVERTRKVILLR